MKIVSVILFIVLWIGIQWFLSTRKKAFFGLIIPAISVVGGILFFIFIVQPGTTKEWIFKFGIILGGSLEFYSEGRKKVKDKREKELEKMTIKDL